MEADFEKAEIETNLPSKDQFTLGKAFIYSTLIHAIVFSSFIAYKNINDLLSVLQKIGEPILVSESIPVSLYEDYLPEPVGYNPKIPLGKKTQTSGLEEKVGDKPEITKEDEESLEVAINRTPEISEREKYFRNKLEEIYKDFKHTYKPGGKDEIIFENFFDAYINSYLKRIFNDPTIMIEYNNISTILKRNTNMRNTAAAQVKLNKDGTFTISGVRIIEGFIDEEDKVLRYYERVNNRLNDIIPKTFIPPESANLKSPESYTLSYLNKYFHKH